MNRYLLTLVVSLFFVCQCASQQMTNVSTNVPIQSSVEKRLSELEAEVGYLRGIQNDAAVSLNSQFYQPNIEVGAEFVYLKPHSTSGLGPSSNFAFPSPGLQPSWRAWAGASNVNGLGIRARYWEMDQLIPNQVNPFVYSLDAFVADAELTMKQKFGDLDVLLSAGVRHVEFDEIREPSLGFSEFTVDSQLTGFVVGGEWSRQITPNVKVFGIGRIANVFGEANGELPIGSVFVFDGIHALMWETQLGAELTRQTTFGKLSVRSGLEIQYWDDITFKNGIAVNEFNNESIGLLGFFSGIVLSR